MLRRTYLLSRLVWPRDISFLYGRHPIVYIKVVIQYIAILLFVFLTWRLLETTFPQFTMLPTIFAIIAGIFYMFGVFLLMRNYFDVMVGTKEHLYIVQRDSFFKYHLKILTWSSIQDISFSPTGHIGAIIKDSTIFISTKQDEVIEFDHVFKADQIAKKMYDLRDDSLFQEDDEDEPINNDGHDDQKFKVLVETLGEVIVDYMKKKEE